LPYPQSLQRNPTSRLVRYPSAMPVSLPPRDKELVQIVDAALLDTQWRSGDWLICKPGCTPCCIGVFAIDQLDVLRLQQGLVQLDASDPQRASRVRQRAREAGFDHHFVKPVSEAALRHKLAIWYARQLPQDHPLLK